MSVRLVHCHIYAFAMQTFLMSFLQEAKEWSNGARSLRLTFIGTWRPFLFIICSHKLHSVQCLGDWPCPCPLPVKPLPHGTWVYATCILGMIQPWGCRILHDKCNNKNNKNNRNSIGQPQTAKTTEVNKKSNRTWSSEPSQGGENWEFGLLIESASI